MRDLQAAYRRNLPSLINELEAAASGLRVGRAGADEDIRRIAHQLKGSGGSYGFPEVSEAAASVLIADEGGAVSAVDSLLGVLAAVAAGDAPHPARILLIDDDPLIRHLVAATIGSGPYELVEAESFAAAGGHLDAPLDLIILDLFLPDGDGREILRLLRKEPATSSVPVVILSGEVAERAQAECLEIGASAFVEKPFDAGQFAALITDLVGGDAPPTSSVAAVAARAAGTPRVLIAEDDNLTASLARDRLERDGFEVDLAVNGLEALRCAEEDRYDLVILDVKMPYIDGFQLLSELRSRPRYDDVPIVILTAMGSEHSVVRAFELGASDYILKPFSPTELTVRVERLLGM